MNARFYDAKMGRFLSEDPAGLSGGDLTLYSYASNNPVFVDPSGLCSQSSGGLGTYGNYGGPGWGDPTFKTPPTDIFDAQYQLHDSRYSTIFSITGKQYLSPLTSGADRELINNLNTVLKTPPSELANPPSNYMWAATYARSAQVGFTLKINVQDAYGGFSNMLSNFNSPNYWYTAISGGR